MSLSRALRAPLLAQRASSALTFPLFCGKLSVASQKPRLCGVGRIAYEEVVYQCCPSGMGPAGQSQDRQSFDMNDLMLSSLKSYWERLRAGRIAPYRAEIDPRQFESALENMFIVERVGESNMRIRLAGMKVCEMMGMEVRGMEPGFLVDATDRERLERLLNVVMSEPSVVELKLEAPCRASLYQATMLLMPLRSDFGDINRVLGCISGENDMYAAPLAFSIRDVAVTPIEPSEGTSQGQAVPGFAEAQSGFEPAQAAPRLRTIEGNPNAPSEGRQSGRKPKLRVIDGN